MRNKFCGHLCYVLSCFAELGKYYWCPDENFKAAQKNSVLTEITPGYMKKIDAIVKDNNGFLANKKVTLHSR